MSSKLQTKILKFLPLGICLIFLFLYSVLALLKHQHFLTGYDLAIADQAIWKYSQFKNPIITVHAYYDKPIYYDHFEPIYILISPFYRLLEDIRLLILLQIIAVCVAGYAVYLLSISRKIIFPVALSILITFLAFFGIQNALWSDVHSVVLAIPFLAFFIYFLEKKKARLAAICFIFAILCKEDIALFTFLISLIYFFYSKNKTALYFAAGSILYLLFIFGIFFPYMTDGYKFQNSQGLLSNLKITNFYNTNDKREAIFYSLASFGFLPLAAPIYLILFLADLGHYFVLGSDYVSSAQGLFLHYRATLALFLAWPAIIAISRFKKLNRTYIAIYLFSCTIIVQYILHLPLSYLTKSWFWQTPPAVHDIEKAIKVLPSNASLATQVNIAPHLTHRDEVYLLWPASCGESCQWFRIGGKVEYILVDTSTSWDARHFLEDREQFIEGLKNLEKAKVVQKIFQSNHTVLYKVVGKI